MSRELDQASPTREAWLESAIAAFRPSFPSLPSELRVSVGFPSKGATSAKRRRIGECWDKVCAQDGHFHLFISPLLGDPVDVLATLLHELVHAAVGCKAGHKGPFKRLATSLGLTGKMTETVPGPELRERLNALLPTLGEYPHGALSFKAREKIGSRLLKAECDCGAVIRVTQKLVDFPGLPVCACGLAFHLGE